MKHYAEMLRVTFHCESDTLDRMVDRGKAIRGDAAASVMIQVARGLKHAHEHGILHRDIKPADIFICTPTRASDDAQTGPLAEGVVVKIWDPNCGELLEDLERTQRDSRSRWPIKPISRWHLQC